MQGFNEAKLLEFIKEFTDSYYPDKMSEKQISDDAIRRFNGGRENRWDPTNPKGFSSVGNCKDAKWIAHPEETKNPAYITKVRAADGCIPKQEQ